MMSLKIAKALTTALEENGVQDAIRGIRNDLEKWRRVVQEAKIKVE